MKAIEPKPIKRHNALVQLSREHHFGLLLVWKIRQGLKNNISPLRLSDYILFFSEQELRVHFREEENTFFNKLPQDDLLAIRAYKEHKLIYSLINEISENKTDNKLLARFASALEDHIRFEERILFNHLQNTLSTEELEKLDKQNSKRARHEDDTWKDKFWEEINGNFQPGITSLWLSFIFSLSLVLFAGCNSESNNSSLPQTSSEHLHHEVNSTKLTLNNGIKWKADSITNLNVATIESIVSSAAPATTDQFHSAGSKVQDALNKLVQDCKMRGADHEALHHWLEPVLEINSKLMESKTLEEATEYFLKEKEQILVYSKYFE